MTKVVERLTPHPRSEIAGYQKDTAARDSGGYHGDVFPLAISRTWVKLPLL